MMAQRIGLFSLLTALLGYGVLWQCYALNRDGRLPTRAIRLTEVGNRRAFEMLTALGHLSVTPDRTAFDRRGTERTSRGLLEWSVGRGNEGPMPSTAFARDTLGTEFPFDAVSIAIDPADWSDPDAGIFSNPLGRGKQWERSACLSLFRAGRLAVETTIGIRIHGNTSRELREKSLRLIFSPLYGSTVDPAALLPGANGRTLVIRNETRIHSFASPIAFEFAALLGCDVPRTRPVRLLLNGVEQRDVYCLTEHMGRGLLRARLGHDQFVSVNQPAGWHPKAYRKQYLRVRDHKPTRMQDIAQDVDIDDLINYLTAVLFCSVCDMEQGLVYRDQADPNGRWRWIVWDLDFAFRELPESIGDLRVLERSITEFLMNAEGFRRLLFRGLMTDDPAFRTRFLRRVARALNHELPLPHLLAILARYRAITSTYGAVARQRTLDDLDQIEDFIRKRPALLRQELVEQFAAGPMHRVALHAPPDVVMRVDGHLVEGPYIGHYFAGQAITVEIDGQPVEWRVHDRPAGSGNRLEVPVDRDLQIEAIAR